MNILLLINELGTGGAERIVLYLTKYLPKIDPQIKIYLFLLEKIETTYPIPKNIKIIYGSKNNPSHLFKFLLLPSLAIKVKKIQKQFNIDIVLSVLNRANYVNVLSRMLGSSYRCILSERNTASLVYSSRNLFGKINRSLIKYLYTKCDKIIAISKGVKKDLHTEFGIPLNLVDVIYNPQDIDLINSMRGEAVKDEWLENKSLIIIITVGRLEKQKNQGLLIRAFKIVSERFNNSRLLIIGEGSERENLTALINQFDLQEKVQLPGVKNNPFSYVHNSDLFVLSSDYEGFGNVIVEAMACGCPVISTNCQSGPNEIITHKQDGYLTPVGDIEAMSDAIITLLENDKLRATIRENAYRRAEDFSLDTISQQYLQTIRKTVSDFRFTI